MFYCNDILNGLTTNVDEFFTIYVNSESHLNNVRKNEKDLAVKGDFVVFKSGNRISFKEEENNLELIAEKLGEMSKERSLSIKRSIFIKDRFLIFLERHNVFQSLIGMTLQSCQNVGLHNNSVSLLLTTEFRDEEDINFDLSNLRVLLLKNVSLKLFSLLGYNTEKTKHKSCDDVIELHYSLNGMCRTQSDTYPNLVRCLCAPVLDSRKGSKATMMAGDYSLMRLQDIRANTEYKYGDRVKDASHWEDMLSSIRDAAVSMDLLNTRPNHSVTLDLDPTSVRSRHLSGRGAPFILYNFARISEIEKQYQLKVSEGFYPPLVKFEEVDFSLLINEEEWELLFNYILVYPNVLRESIEKFKNGVIRIDLIWKFLSSLCNSFSGYYRRVRILTEPRAHLLPVMFARLYLLKAIEQVLNNALYVLNIKPVTQM